jgi:hypothetical protein
MRSEIDFSVHNCFAGFGFQGTVGEAREKLRINPEEEVN